MNLGILIGLLLQAVIAKASRIAGAIVGYIITTGIFLWGLSVYRMGDQITYFGVSLSQPWFWILCLGWYVFDTNEFVIAKKEGQNTKVNKESILRYLRAQKGEVDTSRIKGAVKWIIEESGEEGIDLIISIIDDRTYHESVRLIAISNLVKFFKTHNKRVTHTLARTLLKDPSVKIRSAAAIALRNGHIQEVIIPLKAALKDDNQQVRQSAQWALDKLGVAEISEENSSAQNEDYPND